MLGQQRIDGVVAVARCFAHAPDTSDRSVRPRQRSPARSTRGSCCPSARAGPSALGWPNTGSAQGRGPGPARGRGGSRRRRRPRCRRRRSSRRPGGHRRRAATTSLFGASGGVEHVGLEVAARARGDADGADRGVAVVDEPLVDAGRPDDEPAGGRLVTVVVGGDVLVRPVLERGHRRCRRTRRSPGRRAPPWTWRAPGDRRAPSAPRPRSDRRAATTAHSAATVLSDATSWRGVASSWSICACTASGVVSGSATAATYGTSSPIAGPITVGDVEPGAAVDSGGRVVAGGSVAGTWPARGRHRRWPASSPAPRGRRASAARGGRRRGRRGRRRGGDGHRGGRHERDGRGDGRRVGFGEPLVGLLHRLHHVVVPAAGDPGDDADEGDEQQDADDDHAALSLLRLGRPAGLLHCTSCCRPGRS